MRLVSRATAAVVLTGAGCSSWRACDLPGPAGYNLRARLRFLGCLYYFRRCSNRGCKSNSFKEIKDYPAKTELSDKISEDLKKRGMNFVGSTIIYAYLQSVGVVNDHQVGCFRKKE